MYVCVSLSLSLSLSLLAWQGKYHEIEDTFCTLFLWGRLSKSKCKCVNTWLFFVKQCWCFIINVVNLSALCFNNLKKEVDVNSFEVSPRRCCHQMALFSTHLPSSSTGWHGYGPVRCTRTDRHMPTAGERRLEHLELPASTGWRLAGRWLNETRQRTAAARPSQSPPPPCLPVTVYNWKVEKSEEKSSRRTDGGEAGIFSPVRFTGAHWMEQRHQPTR